MTDTDSAGTRPETALEKNAVSRRTGRFGWLRLSVTIGFALFYGYDLFEAISNVVGVTSQITLYNQARSVVKLDPVPIPWLWLVVDVLLAPVAYLIAFLIGRKQAIITTVLLFMIGLTLVAATTLSVEALA